MFSFNVYFFLSLYFICCRSNQLFTVILSPYYIGTKGFDAFLGKREEVFVRYAGAKEVASELRRRKVIPERVETKIERAPDRKTANGLLYDHLYAQGTFQTLEIVCDVFVEEEGYPRMNQLGERMKEELRHILSCKLPCIDGFDW